MKLSEILRDKSLDVDNEMLDMAADLAEQLETELDNYKAGNKDLKTGVEILEGALVQLEEQKDDLLNKLVAGEELYISRGMEIVQLEKKNKSLMKLAGMYIKSYEELAFGGTLKERE